MSTWVPPRRSYHLRIFAISLLIVVIGLVAFLFFVQLEAIVPATGVIAARDQREVRSPLAGPVELGWYDAEVPRSSGPPWRVRLDGQGNGNTDPQQGDSQIVTGHKLKDVTVDKLRFHKLEAGDELWPGQVLARVKTDDLEQEIRRLEARRADLAKRGEPADEVRVQLDAARQQLDKATSRVPDGTDAWLVLKVMAEHSQAVPANGALALLAPLDSDTHQPRGLIAILDINEKHTGEVEPGMQV